MHYIKLEELSEHLGVDIQTLKQKTYAELENLEKEMNNAKFMDQVARNAADKEYERLVLKYFYPVKLLENWFTKQEIVRACADTGVTENDICGETLVEPGMKCHYVDAEFLRTSVECVPQYDRSGRELMKRAHKKMDVYRIAYQYQGCIHGKVILELLYGRYPELKEFGFSAYKMDSMSYEIYPKNSIYTNFTALMTGNVDAILHRNRVYCQWYNNGRYSPSECEKAFRTEDATKMFDLISRIGYNERKHSHSPVYKDKDENFLNGMPAIGRKNGMCLFMDKDESVSGGMRRFIIWTDTASVSLTQFLEGYMELMEEHVQITNLHILAEKDWLANNGRHITIRHNVADSLDSISVPEAKDITGCFGCVAGVAAELTVRIKEN